MAQKFKEAAKSATHYESASFVLKAQSQIEDVGPGLRRQLLGYNDELMAVRVWFEKGAVGELHKHPHSQVAYVESGRFEVTVGDETKILIAGDSFYVPPHAMHGAVCKEAGALIDMFSPVRKDFLSGGDQGYGDPS